MSRLSCMILSISVLSFAGASFAEKKGFEMGAQDLAERGEREITELHQFFQDWYRGSEAADFQRFDQVLAEGFSIILPDGRILERAVIVDAVRGQHDSDSQAELEIRNVRLHKIHRNTAIFTYEEWQGRQGRSPRGRLSTVVFAGDQQAPNGLVWLHVHETWLPGQTGEND